MIFLFQVGEIEEQLTSARRELARSEEANQKLQRDLKEVRVAERPIGVRQLQFVLTYRYLTACYGNRASGRLETEEPPPCNQSRRQSSAELQAFLPWREGSPVNLSVGAGRRLKGAPSVFRREAAELVYHTGHYPNHFLPFCLPYIVSIRG